MWKDYFVSLGFTKTDSTLRSSHPLTRSTTNRALRCLTSEVKGDLVYSKGYCRQREAYPYMLYVRQEILTMHTQHRSTADVLTWKVFGSHGILTHTVCVNGIPLHAIFLGGVVFWFPLAAPTSHPILFCCCMYLLLIRILVTDLLLALMLDLIKRIQNLLLVHNIALQRNP